MREPQGINPAILMLDLHLVQKPGMWPQVLAVAHARYDRVLPPGAPPYKSVEVLHNNERVAFIEHIRKSCSHGLFRWPGRTAGCLEPVYDLLRVGGMDRNGR